MTDILNCSLKDMTGLGFDCSCGKRHSVGIRHILTGNDILDDMADILVPFTNGTLFLMTDNNTWTLSGLV
jgi:glycerol-1-phosphate dehydrogenase [NAD(P)+]